MKNIGFIGLGTMGLPICMNLLKAGFDLTVWNRTPSRMADPVSFGAKPASSAKEVASNTEAVVVMVGDSGDVEQVVMGPLGLVEGAKEGLVIIDMSSISPMATRHMAEELKQKNIKMLDAPVSGGEIGAIEATLSIMVGGEKEIYEQCLPIFKAVGKQVTYMGKTGSGQATKLCNQVICAMNIQGICEGLTLGDELGLDAEKLLEVLTAGYASSRILSHLGPKMINSDFKPSFKMRHQLKDLKNALDTAASLNTPLPCTSLVNQLFRAVAAMGLEEEGTQTAILIMKKLAGHRTDEIPRDR